MPTITPTNALVEEPSERQYSPKTGWRTIRRFGGEKSQIEAQANLLISDGYEVSIRYGAVCKIEASIGQDVQDENPQLEAPVYNWELLGNPIENDMLRADISTVASCSDEGIATLRAVQEGSINIKDEDANLTAFLAADSNATALYKLYKYGTKSVQTFSPVLRRSYTVTTQYQISSGLTNVGKVYSSAALIAAELVPAALSSNIPASSTVTRASISFYYGWLKAFPQIQISVGNKASVSQEWQWGLWAGPLYATVGSF